MDYNKIPIEGTWQDAAEKINDNFNLTGAKVDELSKKTDKNKGLFTTLENLKESFPTPVDGDWAYVGTSLPATIYTAKDGIWSASGGTGGGSDITLTDYLQSEPISDITQILD